MCLITRLYSISIMILRIFHFAVVFCVYVRNSTIYTMYFFSTYVKRLFTNLILFNRIAKHMCMHTCSCQTMMTETSKATNFKACSFITCSCVLVSNPFNQFNIFVRIYKCLSGGWKKLQNNYICSLFLY